jgi:HD-GYP domain-containing protein (c-di-GMP phosphodiesterase class II)
MQVIELTSESKQDLLHFISSIPIFYKLPPDSIRAIMEKCQVISARADETIFSEGDPGDSFYMIREGHCKTVRRDDKGEMVLSVMETGEGFGEMALLLGKPRSATIKAVDDCTLVRLMASDLKKLTLENQELLIQMNRLMEQRVSLLDVKDGQARTETFKAKFRSAPRFEMDPTVLDLLLRLNDAAGGKGQIEHCKETAILAREMAKLLCPMVADEVFYAGYLHEIGKIALSRNVIEKQASGKEPLTPEEEAEYQRVWKNTLRILKPDRSLYEAVRFLEFMDRAKYEEMPLEAQIIKATHEYLEMVSPHYRAMNEDEAMEEMKRKSGTRYNPRIVKALDTIVERFRFLKVEKQIKFIRQMNIALDVKDNYTLRHSYHVRMMALKIGDKNPYQWAPDKMRERLDLLHMACDMHDVGKIFIPAEILNAPRKLTPEEFDVMKKHPVFSAQFFEDLPGMRELMEVIKHHHERWDGRGYPDGLAGEGIPELSRIEVCADVWSALTTPRVYRVGADGRQKAYSPQEALDIMTKMEGHFDPIIFETFERIVQNEKNLEGSDWQELETVDVDSPNY